MLQCALGVFVVDQFIQYWDTLDGFLTWLFSQETKVPLAKLMQGLAGVITAVVSALGFYKAWLFAEKRLGLRLEEFIKDEEKRLSDARSVLRDAQDTNLVFRRAERRILTNSELRSALRHLSFKRPDAAKFQLEEAITLANNRESLARDKADLHKKQAALAHLLLGALADEKENHTASLSHFRAALEFDENDLDALEYCGMQLLKLGDAALARGYFDKLAEEAGKVNEPLIESRAYFHRGLTYEVEPQSSPTNANSAYIRAIEAYPEHGPVLDIARVHEARGLANLKLGNVDQAEKSLMLALARYSQINSKNVSKKTSVDSEGLTRIHKFLGELNDLKNGTSTQARIQINVAEKNNDLPEGS